MIENASEWKLYLNKAQYVINNTHHTAIKNSPAKILLGIDCRSHEDKSLSDLVKQLAHIDTDLVTERSSNRDIAAEATERVRTYNKQYYDVKHATPSKYQPGEYVMIRDTQAKPGQSSKFKSAYKGPYVISKVLKNNRFVVTDIPGFNVASKPYNTIVSPDKLKPWIKPLASTTNN
ncbi:uncharacterized protein LOC109861554 [Pseudomyrmex gracilis]|uniref:uncharacterized protein LOC109861554 n=1 Tax=Pseudomyrmex gracilis TaxID=219809 RepID=UPI000995726B|nr:uncharacterized protein LOC109861554 [Pseudomyrmex gracilis]